MASYMIGLTLHFSPERMVTTNILVYKLQHMGF